MRGVRVLIVLCLSVMVAKGIGQDCQPEKDSAVLVDLFGATKGLNWKVKWNFNQEYGKWHGIEVNQSGCVTAIEIPENGLQGTIPNLDLPFLERLDISGNNILSSLPDFSKVPSLEHLNVSHNRFRGALPALENSSQMETIKANNNQMGGQIPDYGFMTELQILNLANNKLTGNISVISNFSKLTHLNLNNNQFQGNIPVLNDNSGLTEVDLSENNLTGVLPDLDSLTMLTKVNLSNNQLSGSFQWPENVPELLDLRIANNILTDTIANTGPVGKLTKFYADHNQFTGSIPEMNLPSLTELLLSQNSFSGSVPDFSGLPVLEQFSVRHNELQNVEFGQDLADRILYADMSENKMTFQDLVPFRNYRGSRITLFPQKNITFELSSFTITKGNNFTIEPDTDESDFSTEYQWYKNGERLNGRTRKNYPISNAIPRDAGQYSVIMTNTLFPGFPIMSEVFTLLVNCPQVIEERTIYLCPGEKFSYKETTYTRDTFFTDTVYAQSDLVCDSLYFFDIVNYEPDSVHSKTELCSGEIYYFGPDSIELTQNGTYLDTFPNIGGCDSIVLLDLEFRKSYEKQRDVGLCPGDSLVFQDSVYFEDVLLIDSFTSVYGCDSLIVMDVRFSDPVRTTTRYDLCEGDSIAVDGQYYSASTSWTDTLTARAGCDSISSVEIMVHDNYEETLNVKLCSPETFEWLGRELSASGNFSDTLQTIYGCDSIVHLNLTISPSHFSRDTLYMCLGDSVLFNGTWITGSGIYFSDQTTTEGCDSMDVLVLEFQDYATMRVDAEICAGDTLTYNDKQYTEIGTFVDTLYSAMSCDTLVTILISNNEVILANTTIVGTATTDSTGSITVDLSGGIPPYSFEWSTGDTISVLDSVPVGTYMLLITDSVGCTTSFIFQVPVLTFVWQKVEKKNWISIRPNYINRGSQSSVSLDVQESMTNSQISLYSEMGQRVDQRKFDFLKPGESIVWELGALPAGLYYFHIREERKIPFQVERLVVF